MNTSLLRLSRALGSCIALTVGAAAVGAELEYGMLGGVSYSNNVERAESNEQRSGAAVIGIDLRGQRTSGRLLYDVFSDLEYRDYFESGVDSQTFGRVIAQSSYAILPETFEWMLSGSFDQVRQDLLRPAAPGNLEDVITFSTGPRVTGRFGDALETRAEAHYTVANYTGRRNVGGDVAGMAPLTDNETLGALATIGRRLSERSYFGIGASYDDVTYDTAPATDFQRREYFLRLEIEGARTRFEADTGYSEVSGVGLNDSGPMARARLTRRLTPFVSTFIGYTREFPTTSESAFTPAPEQGGLIEDSSILTAAPRENETAELGLSLARPRTSGTLVYARRRESTLGPSIADRSFDEVWASLTRLITNRSTLGFYGAYVQEDVAATGVGAVESDEKIVGAELNLVFGRALGIEVRVEHRERDSTDRAGSYKELSGGVFVRYGSARRFQQPMAGTQ